MSDVLENLKFEELTDSSHYLEDHEKLKLTIQNNGYLFLRDVIDVKRIESVRSDYVKILKKYGYVTDNESTDPIWTGKEYNEKELVPLVTAKHSAVGRDMQEVKELQDVYYDKNLLSILKIVVGGDPYTWGDAMERCRFMLPGRGAAGGFAGLSGGDYLEA